jgi:heat shock protein HslJ
MYRLMRVLLVTVSVVSAAAAARAADGDFPYESELILDVAPMRGSKQIPNMDIGPQGQASIQLWCNSVTGQLVVAGDTVTIITGQPTTQACPPERMQADDQLLAALAQVMRWRRSGSVITFEGDGATPIRFRMPTN